MLLGHPSRVANPFPMQIGRCTKRLGQDHVVPYATRILGKPRIGSTTNESRSTPYKCENYLQKWRPVETGMKKFLLPDCSPCQTSLLRLVSFFFFATDSPLNSLSSVFTQVSSTIDSYNEDRRRLFEALSEPGDV